MSKLLYKKSQNYKEYILPKSVWRRPIYDSKHTIFRKMFYKFFGRSWKNAFALFEVFFYKKMLILFHNVLCNCKAFNNNGNKWLLLHLIKKKQLLDVQKFQRPQN